MRLSMRSFSSAMRSCSSFCPVACMDGPACLGASPRDSGFSLPRPESTAPPPAAMAVRLFSKRALPWSISACRAVRSSGAGSQQQQATQSTPARVWPRDRARAAPAAAHAAAPLSAVCFLLLLPPICENCCGGLLSTALFIVASRWARRASSIAWSAETRGQLACTRRRHARRTFSRACCSSEGGMVLRGNC